jgi:hypothetical protein
MQLYILLFPGLSGAEEQFNVFQRLSAYENPANPIFVSKRTIRDLVAKGPIYLKPISSNKHLQKPYIFL